MTKDVRDPVERIIYDALTEAGISFVHDGAFPKLDFYLHEINLHIECKRAYTPRAIEQCSRFENVILVQGIDAAKWLASVLLARDN